MPGATRRHMTMIFPPQRTVVSSRTGSEIGREEAMKLFLDYQTPFLICSSRALAKINNKNMFDTDSPLQNVDVVPVPPLTRIGGRRRQKWRWQRRKEDKNPLTSS